ncbi:A disintegrin and metalloproteinase with thrombospondin motifs 8 isoform X4 [Rhagoletis pomonella]|uniref:A disintegrin and metalloproteinase with thrombospondin motifs 8 isoform X4 n=1 Tax=Rhagoletis pomonella TaxID=28610 RepID=UPI00177CB9C8|nr:A disintegrin and metalloproteinase with thrombospondin motifs 8 isoform X4 [Rhagoletis pomonella]
MSHNIAILLAIVASIVTTCTSLPDYHKQMSPTQLQSVFHVESADAVPHYEVVQLLHHSFDDGVAAAAPLPEHYRRRRRRSINSISLDTDARVPLKEPHHVKKDLSKNPYYSELKAAASAPGAGGANSLEQATRGKFAGDLRELKEHKVSLNAFGENLNLTLKQTDSLFKGGSPHSLRMWTVREEANATHGLDMEEVFDEDAQSSDQIGQVYQDESNMAAILMRRHLETGDLIMEGSIGHEMVIKPLPHELSPNPDAAHHIVYKRDAQPLEHLSDFAFMEPDDMATSEKLEQLQQRRQRRSAPFDDDEAALEELDDELETLSAEATNTRNKRQVPYIIYPEVLVIIDYDGYRLHGGDNLQVKRYFVSFWNGVDLRYRLLKGPRIRISIAGIIISRGRDATPYLERNRVGRDAIDSAAALTDMGKYLFRERRLPVYDIAVAITKLDMCRRTSTYGECNRGTAGFAYVGGACVVNKRLEKVNSVAIIEDTGGFSGIIVAAHEVGHLLGAVHDGSPPPSYLGGPGAQRCRWEDGYIMSDLRHTERGFRWSPCTIQSFHHFLNGDTATCLHNAPHEDSALGRALPGTLLSLDAQCRRDRGTYACFKDERVCAQLFCFDAQTGYCVAYRPAAEGSTCGTGLQCLDGRCTPLPSNVIPAYRSYNNTVSAAAKLQLHATTLHSNDDEDDDDDNTEDNIDDTNVDVDDDDASNEAIDDKQQKRKFNTATTVSVNAQKQQPQQHTQESPPPSALTRSSTTNSSNSGGSINALQRPATFIDAYLKKLQALNTPADARASVTATTTSTTMSTSSVIGGATVGKAEPKQGTIESETEKRRQTDTFGSHFLKLVNWKAFPF